MASGDKPSGGKPSGEDIARHYASAHARLVELGGQLSDDELATPTPATPKWTVHDVYAHLAAIPTDALSGRLQGVPSDDDTARQVAERATATIAELLGEWSANVDAMCDGARAGLVPPNLAVDALTHEQDVRGALRRPAAISAEELRFCATMYAFGCGYGLKQAGVAPLALEATDTDFRFVAGLGEPAACVRATEFELFRALSGRRSRAQVAAFGWSGDAGSAFDPEPYLDRFCVFGPLAAADVHDA